MADSAKNKNPESPQTQWKQEWAKLQQEFQLILDKHCSENPQDSGQANGTYYVNDFQKNVEDALSDNEAFTELQRTIDAAIEQLDPEQRETANYQQLIQSLIRATQAITPAHAESANSINASSRFDPITASQHFWSSTGAASIIPNLAIDPNFIKLAENGGLESFQHCFSSLPTGNLDHWQTNTQRNISLLADFYQQYQAFVREVTNILTTAAKDFDRQLRATSPQPDHAHSLRALYELWLDCCEQAYLHAISTEQFARVYGGLINICLVLKKSGQAATDQLSTLANLPTQSSLDRSHAQQHELRRKQGRMQEQLDRTMHQQEQERTSTLYQMQALIEEIRALKNEVASLQSKLVENSPADSDTTNSEQSPVEQNIPKSDRIH